jgi:hypothetical protein
MNLKCNFCDPTITKKMREQGQKPVKSINTETDSYVKDEKGKYYHEQCYVHHLKKRKKLNEEEAIEKLEERKLITELEVKELIEKDNFYNWIMSTYEAPLPAYYCTKISKIRDGSYEKVHEPIDYKTLLDIYQKMEKYLKKQSIKKGIKIVGQRMNYELAIVLSNYGDYKNHLAKQKEEINKQKEIDESIKEKKRFKEKKKSKKEEFNLSDVMDELLL